MTIKLHDLRPARGSKTARTRVGRGDGSKGKTAGRGTKGSKARKQVPATLAAFGGKFIVRGGKVTVHEGEWPHPSTVVIEFPSRAQAEGCGSPAHPGPHRCCGARRS